MRSAIVLALGTLLNLTGCASAQGQPQQGSGTPPAQSPATMPTTPVATTLTATMDAGMIDGTLDRLEKVGKALNDFTADATLTTIDNLSGDETARLGKVYFQTLNDDSRIRVSFDTYEKGDRQYEQKIEYVLQKGVLTDRNYETKVEVRRQVLKPGEKTNLLKLGEGPFPLPIGQDKAQVHELFEVTPIAAAPSDPASTMHLKLVPKPDTQFADKFASIDVWVDEKTDFPVRIDTQDTNNTSIRRTKLENVNMNAGLKDVDFQLEAVQGWNVKTEEYAE